MVRDPGACRDPDSLEHLTYQRRDPCPDCQTRGQPRRLNTRSLYEPRTFDIALNQKVGERLLGRVELRSNTGTTQAQILKAELGQQFLGGAEEIFD